MKSTDVCYKKSIERLDEEHGVDVKPMTGVDVKPMTPGGYCQFSVLERVLMVLVGVMLIVTILLAILYATKMSESDTEGKKCPEDRMKTALGELFQKSVEWGSNPCNDFYKFSCSKWMESHEIPDTLKSLNQFTVLSEKNSEFIKAKLDNKEIIKKYEKNEAVSKALMDYFACMEAEKMNDSLLVKYEQNLIKQYGSWNITAPNWRNSNWDLMTNLVNMHRSLGIRKPLFISTVQEDQRNSSRHIVTLTQTVSFSMNQMDYLSNSSHSRKKQAMYKDLILSVVSILANTSKHDPDIVRQVNDIYNFEAQLAKIEMPSAQMINFQENLKKITLKQLQKYTGKTFNWLKYYQKLFAEIDVDINEEMYVAVYQLDYMRNMSEIIGKTDDVVLGNYMMWQVISSLSSYLSNRTVAEFNKFRENIFGTRQEIPRWQYCLGSTRSVLGLPLSVLYTDEKFNEDKLKHIEEMVSGIREVFVENIQNIAWMDPETKKEAVEKAKSIKQNIGFPKILLDQKKLNKRYEELEIDKDDFLGNALRKRKYFSKKNLEKISQPVDKSEWSFNPDNTNAFYTTSKHKIVFPAGILQAPFFDASRPKSLNYGAIGMVIGHELTHSFGNIGGNVIDWWSDTSVREFKNRTACLEKKYSGYTFHNFSVNGQRTLKENIADAGGIKQAFQAYKRWTKANGDEPGFPSLNFTNDQLFFIGFAQTWCAKYRESKPFLQRVAGGARHAPQKIRVIGSLSNFPEFSKAFNCRSGTRMNPVLKCNIWK